MICLERIKYSDLFWASIFLLPNLLGFIIFILLPVLASFGISFLEWDLLGEMDWIGLGNYKELMTDSVFWKVLWNTIYFTVVTVPVGIMISLFLAIALNQKIRGLKIFRSVYFLPVISSMVAVAMVWQWIYNPQFGLLNYLLSLIGINGPSWLSSTIWAMPAVMITSIWKCLGFNMLLFLAGLQGISETYYEAAEIDGANWFSKFRNITIPLLSPTTFFVIVMSVINSFQVFDQIYIMTQGGPARSTSVLVHYLYQNAFQYYRMGYASSIAYVLFFLVFIVTLIQLKRSNKWVVY
ncbi:ABC transporter permease subunit [Iocasia frigidifontis]|uniref:ABC transporter permease subunit n=1 Tax=Iocasia fonsfrigidae TaxID=2682810 RepID=A0A8A7KD74_9FIRM|nr:sugar ABC transporter permease [Iocasia fonsfrigidae]QTL99210.1 ABC transporter permease subunit [Iocasia fonsfrigidae]